MPDRFAELESRYNLPKGLLASMMDVESGGRLDAVSHKGARGPFGLMPVNSTGIDPHDPQQAAGRAAEIIAGHLKRFQDLPTALAAYNAGPTVVAKRGIPDYPETTGYIDKVQTRMPVELQQTQPMPAMTDYGTDTPAPETVNQALMRQFARLRQQR